MFLRAIYTGLITPFITGDGAHLVAGGFKLDITYSLLLEISWWLDQPVWKNVRLFGNHFC